MDSRPIDSKPKPKPPPPDIFDRTPASERLYKKPRTNSNMWEWALSEIDNLGKRKKGDVYIQKVLLKQRKKWYPGNSNKLS